MQWVVSLELPGECVRKSFIFPRDISVCTRHTQTIYKSSSCNSFYMISLPNNKFEVKNMQGIFLGLNDPN